MFVKCPSCGYAESKVIDSRGAMEMNAIRRRRECLNCSFRFTTFETADLTIQVKKRDNTYEDFDERKLIKGLDAACRHSRISHDRVRTLVNRIKADLLAKQVREIKAEELGKIVMDHLKKEDVVAYIRFACVYRRFKEPEQLMEAIQNVTYESPNIRKEENEIQKG